MVGLEGETNLDQTFLITSSTALVVGGWWLVAVVVVVSDGDGGGVDCLVQHWFSWLKMCLPGSACLRILDTHSSFCCSWSSKYHCIYWYPKCSVYDRFKLRCLRVWVSDSSFSAGVKKTQLSNPQLPQLWIPNFAPQPWQLPTATLRGERSPKWKTVNG